MFWASDASDLPDSSSQFTAFGEPDGGVNDTHFHPVEPLALRFTLAKAF
jgi:hypothetical protein